jgi:signal transduction histidine kinase
MRGNPGRVIAFVCSHDGIVLEILVDELGVASRLVPGESFVRFVHPAYRQTAEKLLRTARNTDSPVEVKLEVNLPPGDVPLFFSVHTTGRGIVIWGGTIPIFRGTSFKRLYRLLRQSCWSDGASLPQKLESLALAAHDLRNPIAGILAASECLLDDSCLLPDGDHVRLLESIKNSSLSLLRLVEQLMDDVTDPGNEQTHLDIQDIDIVSLIKNNLTLNQLLARSKQIQLTLAVEEPHLTIKADPWQVSEVIDNLVSNAIKFSPPGGSIEIQVGLRNNMAFISVRDQGAGIPTTDLPTIFQPYQRGGNTRKRERGNGLGLAIVKHIVESYQGRIEIESTVGRGSTFTISLPLSAGQVRRSGVGPVSNAGAGG